MTRGTSWIRAPGPTSSRAEKDEADDLDETEECKGRRGGKRPEAECADHAVGQLTLARNAQQHLQGQPFGCEPVERRNAGDRDAAGEKGRSCQRQTPQKTAETIDLERADRALEGAGAEEQQPLEDRVVDRVQQPCGQRDSPPTRPRRATAGRVAAPSVERLRSRRSRPC